jgi:hypothetical protein
VATRTARLHRSHHTGDLSKHRASPTAGATFGAARRTRLTRKALSHLRGTEGSNPSPSSGESSELRTRATFARVGGYGRISEAGPSWRALNACNGSPRRSPARDRLRLTTQVYSADLTFRRNCLQHDPPSIGHERRAEGRWASVPRQVTR